MRNRGYVARSWCWFATLLLTASCTAICDEPAIVKKSAATISSAPDSIATQQQNAIATGPPSAVLAVLELSFVTESGYRVHLKSDHSYRVITAEISRGTQEFVVPPSAYADIRNADLNRVRLWEDVHIVQLEIPEDEYDEASGNFVATRNWCLTFENGTFQSSTKGERRMLPADSGHAC